MTAVTDVLLDTNILLRITDVDSPTHADAVQAVGELHQQVTCLFTIAEGTSSKIAEMNITPIKKLALIFRKALEDCEPERLPICLQNFPSGSCSDASLLLGKFYQENGITGVEYVSGAKREQTHAWLEKDGLIVDITADQFGVGLPPVMTTFDRQWHGKYEETCRQVADFEIYDHYTVSMFRAAYHQVIKVIREQLTQ